MLLNFAFLIVFSFTCETVPIKCRHDGGIVLCNNTPMPLARLRVSEEETFQELHTSGDGSFTYETRCNSRVNNVTVFFEHMGKQRFNIGSDNPDLIYNVTTVGEPKVVNIADARKCAAYRTMIDVVNNFDERTGGRELPYDQLSLKLDDVIVPVGYQYSAWAAPYAFRVPPVFEVALFADVFMHEFGHTLQLSLNGNSTDYITDMTRYRLDPRNLGRAFQEGWAAFWVGKCNESAPPYQHRDFGQVEHNTVSFCELHQKCHLGRLNGYAAFLDVFEANRRGIHSFVEFERAHYGMFGCDLSSDLVTTVPFVVSAPFSV